MTRLFQLLLYWLDLSPRRCMTCKKLLGFKFRIRPRQVGAVTHGLCKPCAVKFEAEVAAQLAAPNLDPRSCGALRDQGRIRRQHRSRKNLRRQTGGWGGAVASYGPLSY